MYYILAKIQFNIWIYLNRFNFFSFRFLVICLNLFRLRFYALICSQLNTIPYPKQCIHMLIVSNLESIKSLFRKVNRKKLNKNKNKSGKAKASKTTKNSNRKQQKHKQKTVDVCRHKPFQLNYLLNVYKQHCTYVYEMDTFLDQSTIVH